MLSQLLQSEHLLWFFPIVAIVVICTLHSWGVYPRYKYLVRGAAMIEKSYVAAKGQPFIMSTPSRKNIMVSSQQHINELDKAPRNVLSLHAVAKEVSFIASDAASFPLIPVE